MLRPPLPLVVVVDSGLSCNVATLNSQLSADNSVLSATSAPSPTGVGEASSVGSTVSVVDTAKFTAVASRVATAALSGEDDVEKLALRFVVVDEQITSVDVLCSQPSDRDANRSATDKPMGSRTGDVR